ncbi:TonB-dependent receptor [Marinoscillum pacificum]|uniref:TonB-dependent receptor n=1 Tax=Marinoscillum pacificum TaxID=392723 RepID=UPI00215821F4|nr:TonB-dependent receptor [Marinoscillum pacificum]
MKNLTKFPTSWFRQALVIGLAVLLSLLYRNVYGQAAPKIDLDLKEVTFEEAVEELIKKTDINIIYNNEQIKDIPRVTLQMKQVTVEEALEELLKESKLTYRKINETIVIGPIEDTPNTPLPPGFKQTLRGTIYDKDSQAPLSFATVQVITTETVKGAISDIDGNFSITNLPIGRHSIKVSFVGYEDAFVNDILLGTGKETIIKVSLTEQLTNLSEVVVTASNGEPINEMATVSAKSFDAEETKRYAASISDPARMALVFAGVATTDDASNEIVIRGNSPNWMLWKLEGVEIPSPNHFAEEGYSSGAISIVSANMLGNSDFYTGAFSADYGNALSGIFDLKLRNGNNQAYEHTFQAGVLGVDFASEGPFKKGYDGSYLFNYRYSTLGLLNALNFAVSENALPSYQDLSFKFNLPTKEVGTFAIWGIGGLSKAVEHFEPDSIDCEDWKYGYHDDTYTGMYAYGVTHNYFIDNNSFVETVLSHSKSFSDQNYEEMDSSWTLSPRFQDDLNKGSVRLSSYYNRKVNSRLTMRTGAILSRLNYNYESRGWSNSKNDWLVEVDTEGHTYLYQGYLMGKYKFTDKIVATGGVHYMRFELNKDQVIEPRLSLAVGMKNQQKLTFGYGRHSRHESLPLYFVRTYADNGRIYLPNRMLELTRASHYVIGYEKAVSKYLNFKVEGYYQKVNNLPVPNNPDKYYTPIFGGFSDQDTLVNKGQARNIGLELTVQRTFANNYYFLVTSSLFDSKYQPLDGKWYNGEYNLNYVNNFVVGKEFEWGENKRVGLNSKVMWTGGKRQYPIDLERSIAEEETYTFENQPWAYQTRDYFRIDAGVKVHFYKNGKEQVISLDIQNVTNRLNTWAEYYDPQTNQVEIATMAGLIPILNYRLEF